MRRPVLAKDPLVGNKRIAEKFFLRAYDLFLEEAPSYRQWAYRKAAWSIEKMEKDVQSVYREQGKKGLLSIKGIGDRLAGEMESWFQSTPTVPGGGACR
jgi:DNA polymerase/3'-5' exonuclease PolX